ncbi:M23 family metallopeptidase, partial [Acaryochloris marina NIES-2412]|uniref:M23 family metallopeptidase n=1 Tax=Acaryochloris marina TaxID=155978 RepID=UPI004058ADF4
IGVASSGLPCKPSQVAGLPGTPGVLTPEGDGIATGQLRNPLPSATVTSEFGWRNHPYTGERSFHEGIDLALPTGTPVLAADGGRVDFSGWNPDGYGYLVVIDHGNGLATWYGHNSVNNVRVGQEVTVGDKIAELGSTGVSTGPHVDFGVAENYQSGSHKSGIPVNPRKYVNF